MRAQTPSKGRVPEPVEGPTYRARAACSPARGRRPGTAAAAHLGDRSSAGKSCLPVVDWSISLTLGAFIFDAGSSAEDEFQCRGGGFRHRRPTAALILARLRARITLVERSQIRGSGSGHHGAAELARGARTSGDLAQPSESALGWSTANRDPPDPLGADHAKSYARLRRRT